MTELGRRRGRCDAPKHILASPMSTDMAQGRHSGTPRSSSAVTHAIAAVVEHLEAFPRHATRSRALGWTP